MSKLPAFDVRSQSISCNTDLVVAFQDSQKKPSIPGKVYSKLLDRLRKSDFFTAKPGTTQFIRFGGEGKAENLLLVGLGATEDLTEEKARSAGAQAWAKLSAEKVDTVSINGAPWEAGFSAKAGDSLNFLQAFLEGMILSQYKYKFEKTKKQAEKSATPTKIILVSDQKDLRSELGEISERVTATGEAVNITRDWSNLPSNIGTPDYYAAESQRLARKYGLKCKILGEREAAREKMGLFLGVGQGSVREGKIVILEYTPKGKRRKTLSFVGKGITFDSGGISIKPSGRMEEMKHDMTGAATMLGATLLASALGSPNRIVTVLAFTENMPGGDAIQPGNVLTARNGKTVEVINTDAEGRLILADALDYAQDFKPDAVINAATLTGAALVALGKHAAPIMGTDDALIDKIRKSGEKVGEKQWPLPLFDEYFEDLKSDYADMRNSANDPYGGTIRGGIFLKQFIRKGVSWAHLDIAGVGYNVTSLPYFPKKGASGSQVRTLAQFALDF